MTALVIDLVGWAGAACLLTAYALVSSGRIDGRGWSFQLLNLAGGLGLAVNGIYHGAWPSAALNVVWLVIGLAAVRRLRRTTTAGQRPDSRVRQR